MLDQKEITVADKQYIIQQLPSSRGMQVAIQIARIISGASKGVGAADSLENIPINVGGIVAGIIEQLDPDQTPALIKRLVMESVIQPEMTPEKFEAEFSGEFDALWDLVGKIIEHNRFVDVIKKKAGAIMSQLFSEPPKPAKSTRSTKGR